MNVKDCQHQFLQPLKVEYQSHKKEYYKLAVLDLIEKKRQADERRAFIYQQECAIMQAKAAELKYLRLIYYN